MLEITTGKLKVLGAAVGVNLALAVGVSVGAVPQLGDGTIHTAAASEVVEEVAPTDARQPGDVTEQAVQVAAPTTVAPATTAPAPTTTVARPRTTTKAPATTKTTQAAAPSTAAPAPTAAAPGKVARRTPSAAEVNSAIAQLKQRVGGLLLLVSPTPAQIDQVGDQVCTAFDNGQSFAQVKATALSMIPPSVTVTAATTDWAVRHAVTLYCPGHASKLV
ncbi:MAG TPA: DUF732 domain-containing protein [Acidimicrobiales bacterium]|nr:DUF732 domain-containing protein [Acidimicrobiales bacterium]